MACPPRRLDVELVTGLVLQAATGLDEELVDAAPEMLTRHVRGWYSNRNDADLPFDDEALVLRFVAEGGKTIGAMLNFNCHATVVGPTNRLLTTDVQGGVRDKLADWIGCVPYIFTGASGDLGNRQFRQGNDFAELRRVSNGIAGEIMKGAFEPIEFAAPKVSRFEHHVHYNKEDFYPQYQAQLDEVLEVLANNPTFDEKKLADTEKEMLEQQLQRHEMDFTVAMTTLDFGSVVFTTFPRRACKRARRHRQGCVRRDGQASGDHRLRQRLPGLFCRRPHLWWFELRELRDSDAQGLDRADARVLWGAAVSAGGVRLEKGPVVAFFDVDGTLVCRDPVTGPGSFPTERVACVVEDFAERGGIPILSTGRARVGIDQLLNNLPFRGYVSLDGAHVVLDGKVILDRCFPRDVLERMVAEMLRVGMPAFFEGTELCLELNASGGSLYNWGPVACDLEEMRMAKPDLRFAKVDFVDEAYGGLPGEQLF